MNKKLNPNEAPSGYVAVEDFPGSKACFGREANSIEVCPDAPCTPRRRKDGRSVIFIKPETKPAEPAPLDARLTIRLPASVKAKAQRIGAAAVIAAIEAVQE